MIVNLTAKWRIRPALTFGNHIQMSKYTYQLATSAVLNIANLVVYIDNGLKSQLFA